MIGYEVITISKLELKAARLHVLSKCNQIPKSDWSKITCVIDHTYHGGLATAISCTVHPRLQMSDFLP